MSYGFCFGTWKLQTSRWWRGEKLKKPWSLTSTTPKSQIVHLSKLENVNRYEFMSFHQCCNVTFQKKKCRFQMISRPVSCVTFQTESAAGRGATLAASPSSAPLSSRSSPQSWNFATSFNLLNMTSSLSS